MKSLYGVCDFVVGIAPRRSQSRDHILAQELCAALGDGWHCELDFTLSRGKISAFGIFSVVGGFLAWGAVAVRN